jgi:hypothetical protein
MNATRAGIARLRGTSYAPLPTAYDRLFPNGRLLTAPTRAQTRCASCNAAMECNPQGACWCMERAPLLSPEAGAACLCPACLERKSAERSGSSL